MSVYWTNNGTNLTISTVSTNTAKATVGRTTGKYYWEIYINDNTGALIGIGDSSVTFTTNNFANTSCRWYYYLGEKTPPNRVKYGSSFTTGDTIGVLLDLDNKILEFFKNGVSQGVAFTNLSSLGEVYPMVSSGANSGTQTVTANFGMSDFTYVPISLPVGTLSYDGSQKLSFLNKTLILHDGEYKKYVSTWETVSSTLPTQDKFLSDGMDSLTPLLDRRIEVFDPQPMTDKSEILNGEEGKVLSKTINLKKYLDIRKINVEVKK